MKHLELAVKIDASPGMLLRRYSVPEIIMRKYRLAQESNGTSSTPLSTSTSPRSIRCCYTHPRELMRRSALLRHIVYPRANLRPGGYSVDCSRSTSPAWGSPERQPPEPTELHQTLNNHRIIDHPVHLTSLLDRTTVSPITATAKIQLAFTDSGKMSETNINDSSACSPDFRSFSLQTRSDKKNMEECVKCLDYSHSDNLEPVSTPEFQMIGHCPTGGIEEVVSKTDLTSVPYKSPEDEKFNSNIISTPGHKCIDSLSSNILDMMVSETLSSRNQITSTDDNSTNQSSTEIMGPTNDNEKDTVNIDVDEYVSHILVESMNSLTDRLEFMNASISNNKRVNVIEKEIKVKLQNTGVNTIVHLSPTSNNQIIFGNEELCDDNNFQIDHPIDELENLKLPEKSDNVEYYNKPTFKDIFNDKHVVIDEIKGECDLNTQSNVNKTILQQIQKLFREEISCFKSDIKRNEVLSNIPHIEVSNVDVYTNDTESFINPDTNSKLQVTTAKEHLNIISSIGKGNYFRNEEDMATVPRFTAVPHTDSMEVNTSLSDDNDFVGSECTSLVDSLDDPNSPRLVSANTSNNSTVKTNLVRSAIDILDLLPENEDDNTLKSKEKGEVFFIRIKEETCDYDKQNIVVADHMPEKIKQRLLRRHRKRQLRMECAKRSIEKQLNKESENQITKETQNYKKIMEKECITLISTLINEIIMKIAQEEYKYMRIKQKSNKTSVVNGNDNLSLRHRKKKEDLSKNRGHSDDISQEYIHTECHNPREQLTSSDTPFSSENSHPKRIYHKSEIKDGDNCIEILEILEYVEVPHLSPDLTRFDEDSNNVKVKKSKIPIPIYERIQRIPSRGRSLLMNKTSDHNSSTSSNEKESKATRVIANTLVNAREQVPTSPNARGRHSSNPTISIPIEENESHCRSKSLRFKMVFDVIPEERNGFMDSSSEDPERRRRVSTPSTSEHCISERVGTSPPRHATKATMTSPGCRSAATSPSRVISPTPPQPLQQPSGHKTYRNEECQTNNQTKIRHNEHKARAPQFFSDQKNKIVERNYSTDAQHRAVTTAEKPNVAKSVDNNKDENFNESVRQRRIQVSTVHGAVESAQGIPSASSDSGSESDNSLLSSLAAPRWMKAGRRGRDGADETADPGWSLTLAGSSSTALPADLRMRLRFPSTSQRAPAAAAARADLQDCECGPRMRLRPRPRNRPRHHRQPSLPAPSPPAAHGHLYHSQPRHLDLHMKKDPSDVRNGEPQAERHAGLLPSLLVASGGRSAHWR